MRGRAAAPLLDADQPALRERRHRAPDGVAMDVEPAGERLLGRQLIAGTEDPAFDLRGDRALDAPPPGETIVTTVRIRQRVVEALRRRQKIVTQYRFTPGPIWSEDVRKEVRMSRQIFDRSTAADAAALTAARQRCAAAVANNSGIIEGTR